MINNTNSGATQRLDTLKRDAETYIGSPLKTHGWKFLIEQESNIGGGYLLMSAKRAETRHFFALIYSSATDNKTYLVLSKQVECIFFRGEPYQLENFIYGINVPVRRIADFSSMLSKWNEDSSTGKFANIPEEETSGEINVQTERLSLLSEEPIEAIWLRIRQLQSIKLAEKLIIKRFNKKNTPPEGEIAYSKAKGLAYSLRNASDYFQAGKTHNLSQRILNIYYGSLAFAFAEMLASPKGAVNLSDIEKFTKQGHGLYTIDGPSDANVGNLIIGVISSGFFPAWIKYMKLTVDDFPEKKLRDYSELKTTPQICWVTLEQLFASIPEILDLFTDIFDSTPRYIEPNYDQLANSSNHSFEKATVPEKSYILLIDKSCRFRKEDIIKFPGPISEISKISSEYPSNNFRVAINHRGKKSWFEALNIHRSPFNKGSMILPIFGVVDKYRAICVTLLYALSIIVRYRPSVWRRIQEGDLDHVRVLIEAFLVTVERILPQQFLEEIINQPLSVNQPGSIFS